MQCTLNEAFDKLEQIDGIIKAIDDGTPLGRMDAEIIRDLLDEYRDILLNVRIKI